ncbi:hypothetical protein GCM10010399_63170 [Dactylosporangium fulvum]|uniref:DUF1751 domain-containing protein n=1 Tax=Dactylosporangium fulvum TaxID=53359 RepID=A0ABY5WCR8_9ACTN|nr:rhomboid family intramembrane serine protease [Dactylosporangium fulvum]UWP87096.1 DUF1751 domain-containing protein [Dactylosporangium fulvum]
MTGFKWLHQDPPGLVPAWYLPGGDLASALAAAGGPAAKAKVLLRAATRLRLAPLYVLAVAVIGFLLDRADPQTRNHLIAANSTNVANLDQHRVWTLVTSAFIVTEPLGVLTVAHLLLLTGAAELLWGRRRLFEVFFLTHVVASCLVYALLRTGIRYEWVERTVATASDVGTSYGAHAVGGALAFSLPVRARRVLVPLALAAVLLPLVGERTFTDVGHLLSTVIGLLAGWQMRRRPLAGRLRLPARMRDDRPMAFAFGTEEEARTALATVLHLQEHHLVHLADAVVTWSDRAHRIHERETRDLGVLDGAMAGTAWGVVLGTLAGFPVAGLVAGAGVVAVVAGLHDAGLPDSTVVHSARAAPPGGVVLVLLTDRADRTRLTSVLAGVGGAPVGP